MEKWSHGVTGNRDWCCRLTEGSSEHCEGVRNFFGALCALSHPMLVGAAVKTTVMQQLAAPRICPGQVGTFLVPFRTMSLHHLKVSGLECIYSYWEVLLSLVKGLVWVRHERWEHEQEGPGWQDVTYPSSPLCCYLKGHTLLCHFMLRAVDPDSVLVSPGCGRRVC